MKRTTQIVMDVTRRTFERAVGSGKMGSQVAEAEKGGSTPRRPGGN
jgi:hypothetical protein